MSFICVGFRLSVSIYSTEKSGHFLTFLSITSKILSFSPKKNFKKKINVRVPLKLECSSQVLHESNEPTKHSSWHEAHNAAK